MGMKPDSQEFSQFLRLAFLRSPNYVAGSAGWTVNQDGSAEFNNVTIRGGEVVGGSALFYSPSPGLGKLVDSISSVGGTDAFGNAYVGGFVSYTHFGGNWLAMQLSGNGIGLFTATGAAGPYNFLGNVANISTIPAEVLSDFPWAFGSTVDVAASLNNQNILTVSNTVGNGGKSMVQLITALATDRALGMQVNGDTSERFRFDMATSSINLGSGAAPPDTQLYRGGVNQLAADPIAANVSGAAEVWNAPTFANGWTANVPALKYRLVAAPYNSMQWAGRIVAPAGIAGLQAITAAVGTKYRPADNADIVALNVSTSALVYLAFQTTGQLIYVSGAVAGNIIAIPAGNGLVSLDL